MLNPTMSIPNHQSNLMLQTLLEHIWSGSVHHDTDVNILDIISPMSSHATNAFGGENLPMNIPSLQDTPLFFQNETGSTPGRQSLEAPFSSEAFLAAAFTQARSQGNETTRALLSLVLARHHEDERVALFLENELTKIMLAASASPAQNGLQYNGHVHYPTSVASPASVAMASEQVCRDLSTDLSSEMIRSSGANFSNGRLSSLKKIAAAPAINLAVTPLLSSNKAGLIQIASKDMKMPSSTSAATILTAIGSRPRNKAGPYVDVSDISLNGLELHHGVRGGVIHPFPRRLHNMLQQVQAQGDSDIVSFYPHGRAIVILNPERFEAEILPKFLPQQRQIKSFVRQLNLYGFIKIKSGPDTGGYYHELFLKGRPELSLYMRRVGATQTQKSRENLAPVDSASPKKRLACDKETSTASSLSSRVLRSQPNFYDMKMIAIASPNLNPIYYTSAASAQM
jgi:hypothetical protein